MNTPIITLPCKAHELLEALRRCCDHDGKREAEISAEDVFVRVSDVPGVALMRRTQLVLCDKTPTTTNTNQQRGENKNGN